MTLLPVAFPFLVSEYPPGSEPQKRFFRERNRVASGLSHAVCVVEAPEQSGALRFARETRLDVFVPYYPLCTDYPLTRAYEMIHATYREMLKDYAPERISVLGTSSGGNLALGMVPYINDGHGDTPMPGHVRGHRG